MAMKKVEQKNIFGVLSSKIRQKIVQELLKRPLTFTEISRILNISTSRLNFHIKKLYGAVIIKHDDNYYLTEAGRTVCSMLHGFSLLLYEPDDLIKVASIGMMIHPTDVDFNIQEALRIVDLIASQRICLVCLPFIHVSQPIPIEEVVIPFQKKAKDLKMYFSFGLFELMSNKKYYSTILVEPQGHIEVYRSIHRNVFSFRKLELGNKVVVVDTTLGKIGLVCGNEYIFPELFRILKLRGADYVVCPAFGMQEKFQKIMKSILIARAIENQLVVAFSSSSFFQKEPFSFVYSPYNEIPFLSNTENVSVTGIDVNNIKESREVFKRLLPRRTDLYRELVEENKSSVDISSSKDTIPIFPTKRLIRKYRIQNEDFVDFEEVTVIGKPFHGNFPIMACLYGPVPLNRIWDVGWSDDFGPLESVMKERKNEFQPIEFLIPNRFMLAHGRSYSVIFKCKTSDPIEVREENVFLNLSFEDLNRAFKSFYLDIDEVEAELTVGLKFEFVDSKPIYSSNKKSENTETFMWKWSKPKKIPELKIKLRRKA